MSATLPAIEDRPALATPALWARFVLVVDSAVSGEAKRYPAAHWYPTWAPHWPLSWHEPIDVNAFTDALRAALQQAHASLVEAEGGA